ncbi:MAG: hypothetical protein ABW185_16170, partial [Sedimenticola sp.]
MNHSIPSLMSLPSHGIGRRMQEYTCHVCHKKFEKIDSVKRHFRDKHGKQLQCEYCDYSVAMSRTVQMERHMQTKHSFPTPIKVTSPGPFTMSFGSMDKINKICTVEEQLPPLEVPETESIELGEAFQEVDYLSMDAIPGQEEEDAVVPELSEDIDILFAREMEPFVKDVDNHMEDVYPSGETEPQEEPLDLSCKRKHEGEHEENEDKQAPTSSPVEDQVNKRKIRRSSVPVKTIPPKPDYPLTLSAVEQNCHDPELFFLGAPSTYQNGPHAEVLQRARERAIQAGPSCHSVSYLPRNVMCIQKLEEFRDGEQVYRLSSLWMEKPE